jgi:hypothetical protein
MAYCALLLHTPLRVVTHLEINFTNSLSQADINALKCSMPQLRSFKLQGNVTLATLNLPALPNLEVVHVNDCRYLQQLVIGACTRLRQLQCMANNLYLLDVRKCAKLALLDCSRNPHLSSVGDLAANTELQALSVWGSTSLTSLNLVAAAKLRELWLPSPTHPTASASLPLAPNARLEVLGNASHKLLRALKADGRIACLKELHLRGGSIDFSLLSTLRMERLELDSCRLPQKGRLTAFPALVSLVIKACSNMSTLDASSATSLKSLRLENMGGLRGVVTPPGLAELTCVGLQSLTELDLSRSPDVRAHIQGCPATARCTAST